MNSLQSNVSQRPFAHTMAESFTSGEAGRQSEPIANMVSGYGQYHSNESNAKVRRPYVSIDLAGVRALVDKPPSVDKTLGQWLIPSTLPSRIFAAQEQSGEYWMLWADLDAEPKPIKEVDGILRRQIIPGYNFELYTSRSAQADHQKARILIPLDKPLSCTEWALCQSILSDRLEAAEMPPDRAALRPAQLCYLPNRGAFYDSHNMRSGKYLDPLLVWAGDIEVRQQAKFKAEQALQLEAKAAAERRQALRFTDAPDTIGAFNRAYTVQEILQRAGYVQRGDTFRHPNSESGSYSASVREGRVHSLSSNDPLYTGGGGGGAHDAFSAFCVLWARSDRDSALRLAGDEWLAIDGESWNKTKQREFMKRQDTLANYGGATGHIEDANPTEVALDPVASLQANIIALDSLSAEGTLPHVVDRWIPHDEVTLLAGHGGGGKSFVALSLGLHVALGLPFGNLATTQTKVLFFSGEDGARVLRLRLAKICRALNIDPRQLDGQLHLLDASDIDPALHREQRVTISGRQQILTETPLISSMAKMVQAMEIGFVIVDNASDAYDDDEIKRARVRTFIRSLRSRIARPGRAVLLLAHINKNSAKERTDAEDYSGSTAWHNSVRSRLSLIPASNGVLTIKHVKANLGVKADPVRLEWCDGVPLVEGSFDTTGAEAAESILKAAERERDSADKAALVELIMDFDKRGERVTTSINGPATVFRLLKSHPTFPKGMGSDKLTRLLRELETDRRIFRRTVKTPDRKWREVFSCDQDPEKSAPNAPCESAIAASEEISCAE